MHRHPSAQKRPCAPAVVLSPLLHHLIHSQWSFLPHICHPYTIAISSRGKPLLTLDTALSNARASPKRLSRPSGRRPSSYTPRNTVYRTGRPVLRHRAAVSYVAPQEKKGATSHGLIRGPERSAVDTRDDVLAAAERAISAAHLDIREVSAHSNLFRRVACRHTRQCLAVGPSRPLPESSCDPLGSLDFSSVQRNHPPIAKIAADIAAGRGRKRSLNAGSREYFALRNCDPLPITLRTQGKDRDPRNTAHQPPRRSATSHTARDCGRTPFVALCHAGHCRSKRHQRAQVPQLLTPHNHLGHPSPHAPSTLTH